MRALNKSNFFIKFQDMLEKYYLQPLDGSSKDNLKDGFIERVIHGAQHSSRTVLWSFIMSQVLENIVPEYSNSAQAKINKRLELTQEQLILTILMTMGCHDAARKREGRDNWETESATITFDVLREFGLTFTNYRDYFASAVQYKDNKDGYFFKLIELGVAESDLPFFDYIRILINLGDNLDIIRCVSHFKSSSIFNTLENIKDFNHTHDSKVYDLIKEIQQFIHDQHDMLYDSTILDREGKTISSLKSNFSKKEKVVFEQAGNVLSAVFAEATQNSKFMPFLNEFSLPESNKYQGNVAFDPFIHGTNSSILGLLTKSEFQIMSPLEMMDEYQVVSMTGELVRGGYKYVGEGTVKEGNMGKTSFGILSSSNVNAFTLESIIRYTNPHSEDSVDHIKSFNESAVFGRDHVFRNINLVLISLARARQTADSLDEVISKDELLILRQQLEATRQYFYFLQLLGTYINPDFNTIQKHNLENRLSDIASEQFTYKNIFRRIFETKINMQEIVNNPTAENLHKALSVLEFPENYKVKHWWGEEFIFPVNQLFFIEPNINGFIGHCDYKGLIQTISNFWSIEEALSLFLRGFSSKSSSFFKALGEKSKQIAIGFEDRIRIFEKLIAASQSHFTFTEHESFFLKERFPLILICEDETKMSMHGFATSEYRSNYSLRLGQDIKMLATDTHAHRLLVMKYLDQHNLSNVQVVLFDDLEKSKQSKQRPDSLYHQDNVQTLQWLCAKQANFFQNPPKFKRNEDTALKLVQDGQKYQSVSMPGL